MVHYLLTLNSSFDYLDFLVFSTILFFFGILGIFVTRKNIILTIVSIEMLFLAVNFNFVIFSVFLDDLYGQIFSLYIVTIAGAEVAVGLAILVIFYRLRHIIAIDFISALKG